MRKYSFLLLLILMIAGCGSPNLERADVPILWGMRLNEPQDAGQINGNLSKMRELVMRNLVLELPLKADSTGLPIVAIDVPSELPGLLSTYRNRIQLAICNTNETELFPQDTPADGKAWFARLRTEVIRNIEALGASKPDRVIIGGELAPMAAFSAEWKELLSALKSAFPETKFSIGGRAEFLDQSGLGAISDELAVDYAPLTGEELKAESRAANQGIAEVATRLGKPLFIYRANVLGEEQLLQIKNRLRFWPEGMQLSGICLNTLYAPIAARDDHTYYGLADDAEAMAFLDEYRRASYEHGVR